MKRIFRKSGKKEGEEINEISLDILLAHKEDVLSKVKLLFPWKLLFFTMLKIKNEYKTFLERKLDIEKELVEVEKHEIFLRY